VIAIDQSSGSKSAVGVCIYDQSNRAILDVFELRPTKKYLVVEKRLIDLHEQLEAALAQWVSVALSSEIPIDVVFERTVMRGKSGQTLAQSVGAFIATFPNSELITFGDVHNLQMKKSIGGKGSDDKQAVAAGLLEELPRSQHDLIKTLTISERWDSIDSIGLAVAHSKKQKGGIDNAKISSKKRQNK
jgi:Holliday junction resolvasome RuvABC endonuclease subunit